MSTPQSPCISVCQLDSSNQVCIGCGRSLEEIGAWSVASAAEQNAIRQRAAKRLQALADTAQPEAQRQRHA